jgi:hypothetical protein
MNTVEVWKDVAGYEGAYQVSNFGRIKRGNRVLKLTLRNTYMYAHLSLHGKQKQARVHRLVAEAFISREENKPSVNHIDGDKQNNRVENLEWCNQSENQVHALQHGLADYGENSVKAKLQNKDVAEIRKLLKEGVTQKNIAKLYNVHPSVICDINTKRKWKYV